MYLFYLKKQNNEYLHQLLECSKTDSVMGQPRVLVSFSFQSCNFPESSTGKKEVTIREERLMM